MIFLSTVMDEEETNTNNSVEHYEDHCAAGSLVPGLHVDVDITITEATSFLQ